jgi:C4-dicarboxylate transporter/malic acid transport protein
MEMDRFLVSGTGHTPVYRPGQILRRTLALIIASLSPLWFTSVMGTGILAICAALSPVHLPLLIGLSLALWAGDALLLAVLLALWLVQGLWRPDRIRSSLHDPLVAQSWGAPPMACFTIATGFLLIGAPRLGEAVCLPVAQGLWLVGVAGSAFSALAMPYLMFTTHKVSMETTYGSWLLPVVPPIVASVPGALLVPSWPAAWQGSMLALSYALWGLGVALAGILIVVFYNRLAYHKVPEGALVTSLWLVVGPLGQSVAGINALGVAAAEVWPALAPALRAAGLAYGLPVWGFGIYWLTLAILLTVRAARRQLPFALGWWALTFPVGVMTTGTYALYGRTGAALFAGAGLGLLALLAAMWALVAGHTVRHSLRSLSGQKPRPASAVPRGGAEAA